MDNSSRGLEFGDSINALNTSRYWSTVQHTFGLKDTTLDSPVYSSFSIANSKALKRKQGTMAGAEGTGNPLLTLGLGRSPRSSNNSKVSSATACAMSPSLLKEADEESSVELGLNFELFLGNDVTHCQTKSPAGSENVRFANTNTPELDLQLGLSTGSPESVVPNTNMVSPNFQDGLELPVTNLPQAIIGKGSIPSNWVFGHSVVSSSYASEATYAFPFLKIPKKGNVTMSSPVISSTMVTSVKSLVACTSVVSNPQEHTTNTKSCQFPGCMKGARGASWRCIAHGGGRRCHKPGCQKGAEGRTIYCKAHGGGRRCQFLGCTKSAEGCTDHCIAHGGGRRCNHKGCSRAARGKSGLCIRHGGGKRCQKENCTRSAEGHSGLCISHGGGRRCQFPECTKGAQGSTKFCKAHGGEKRCSWGQVDSSFGDGAQQCDKFARSKTGLCSAHTALVQDHCVHGGGTLGQAIFQFATDAKPDEMKVAAVKGDSHMKTSGDDMSSHGMSSSVSKGVVHPPVPTPSAVDPFPEGRVHGGGLLALLSRGGSHTSAGNSENGAFVTGTWM